MPHQIEKTSIEDYIVKKLIEKGWNYVGSKSLGREDLEEPLLIKNLVEAIKRINNDLDLDEEDIKQVLKELKLRGTGQEGLKQVLSFLKKGISVKLTKSKDLVRIALFDYKDIENNEFIISRQVIYQTVNDEKRADIMLYVNGIPLVIIECKNPAELNVSWRDAFNQIKGYEKVIPELFKYVQIGIAAEQIAKYFPIVPWEENPSIYEWKEEKLEAGIDISVISIIEMLSKDVLLDILKNYLFFREERGSQTKVITRYMQYRAVEKINNRVLTNLEGKEDKNRGLIWHWQGSGKTLTMIFAANKIYYQKALENPTIFFILDRMDLEEQFYREFNALDLGIKVESIDSIRKLKQVLQHDEGKGKKGFFTVLIHKFRADELQNFEKSIREISKESATIQNRKNILVFVDEGHRTQYGLLAAQMKSLLRNAFFFAFTGTPIAKKEKNTYLEFSYPPQELYLDKYFITDSNNDGFTVKIAYEPRLEKEVNLKREQLEAFLEIEEEEIPEKYREKVKEATKKKLDFAKIYLQSPERIAKIAKDIAENFKENVDGKFKAMVVAVNRLACVRYKKELDKWLPKGQSEIVMTFTQDDPKEIQSYMAELQERYPNKEFREIVKEITNKFNEEQNPKILIVTDMLLTGFDAPILQTMYLDKPLKEHKLLQAIARTNRPYKDIKEAGLIIDYLGILKDFKRAFEIYSKEDVKDILINKEELKEEFKKLIKETLEIFKELPIHGTRMEDFIKALEILSVEEQAKKFANNYKSLRKKFELLGPDIIKAEYAEDFFWLTKIYIYYIRQFYQNNDTEDEDIQYLRRYFIKTLKAIHKSINLDELKKNLPVINFDEEYIRKLGEKYKTKEEKAANIVFTLNRLILVEQHENPIYESLIDKVQRLIELWKEKTKDFNRIYQEGIKIIEEKNKLLERQKELGLNNFEYFALVRLEDKIGKKKELVFDIKELYKNLEKQIFPNWAFQIISRKKIEKEIRMFLIRYVKMYNLNLEQIDELSRELLEKLEKNGKRG